MRIFFASDVHGSDRCFRKFLGAGKFYGADALVLGGDITGKAIVPLVEERPGEVHATFLGTDYVLTGEEATTGRLRPAHPLGTDGGFGAVEATARFGALAFDEDAFPTFYEFSNRPR